MNIVKSIYPDFGSNFAKNDATGTVNYVIVKDYIPVKLLQCWT